MCLPRVRVAAVRLDILTTVKCVQTSHLRRLIVILLIQTSMDVDTCVIILNIHVDIVRQSAMTENNGCITLRRCITVVNLPVHNVSVRKSLKAA